MKIFNNEHTLGPNVTIYIGFADFGPKGVHNKLFLLYS